MAKRYFGVIVLGLLIFSMAVFAGSELNMKDGMWEITSKVKMQGMTIPPVTFSQCITKDNAVPQTSAPGQDNCKVSDLKTSGSTVSWTVICSGEGGEMKGKGKISYQGDRFEGEMANEFPGMDMVMVTKMTGRRMGPCQ